MTRVPPPTDPVEALGEAYELLLEQILDRFRVRDPHHRPEAGEVDELLDEASRTMPQIATLDRPSRERLREAILEALRTRQE